MRTLSVLCAAMILAGCAGTPRIPRIEQEAVVECEASPAGDVRNCVLISQTMENSKFGPTAVETVAKGRLKASPRQESWRKFRTTVRWGPTG